MIHFQGASVLTGTRRQSPPAPFVAARLIGPVTAGLVDLTDGTIRPRACACRSCTTAEDTLDAILESPDRDAALAIIQHAVAFRRALWRVFRLACRPFTEALEADAVAAAVDCQRLTDELGTGLADAVRRLTLLDFGDGTGLWPFPDAPEREE